MPPAAATAASASSAVPAALRRRRWLPRALMAPGGLGRTVSAIEAVPDRRILTRSSSCTERRLLRAMACHRFTQLDGQSLPPARQPRLDRGRAGPRLRGDLTD